MISTALPIETPEGISFTYDPASLFDRGKAYGLDLLLRMVVIVIIGLFFALLLGSLVQVGVGLWLLLAFLMEWGYFVFFEMLWDGQSPGKRVFRLRVVTSAGHPIGFYDSVLRNLLRAADLMPLTYAVGAFSVMATRRFQRLGDLAADTIVVHERKLGVPALTRHFALAHVQLHGMALSNRDRWLLQEFAQRADRLHPDRGEELAEILAASYCEHFGLPRGRSAMQLLLELHATAHSERSS